MQEASQTTSTTSRTPELLDLIQRGMQGDTSALPGIKRAFDDDPQLAAMFGDLVSHAQQQILGLLIGQDLVAREAITRQMAELRASLAASCSSPLEQVLVDRIVLTWLAVLEGELDLARKRKAAPGAVREIEAAVKRLDRAHARHLAATKVLATVQKLLRPAPSVLDLLGQAVPETSRKTTPRRRTAASPSAGAPVAN